MLDMHKNSQQEQIVICICIFKKEFVIYRFRVHVSNFSYFFVQIFCESKFPIKWLQIINQISYLNKLHYTRRGFENFFTHFLSYFVVSIAARVFLAL